MAARRRKPSELSRLGRTIERLAERPIAALGAIVVLMGLVSTFWGSTLEIGKWVYRHIRSGEVVAVLEPRVEAQEKTTKALEAWTETAQKRLETSEKTQRSQLAETRAAREKAEAIEIAQRADCLDGDLSPEACARLGYPTAPQK